jgi:hypothetical protein
MRTLTPLLTLLALALPAASAAAGPPVPAPPNSEASGVTHLGNIPINGSVGANFKKYGAKTYMFLTGTLGSPKTDPGVLTALNYGGLFVYDVTNAENPALVSHLPVPHYENEDVSLGGNRLLISGDGTLGGSNLVVVDIADPQLPKVSKVINMSANNEGHTATCIQACKYAWVAGDNNVKVLNLDGAMQVDPTAGVGPAAHVQGTSVEVGAFSTRHNEFGWAVHDVQVDDAGIAWVVGGNGTIAFDVNPGAYGPANLRNPTVVARTNDNALERQTADGSSVNDFIHHNALRPDAAALVPRPNAGDVRPGEKVLITEEDIWSRLGLVTRGGCKTQGSFQVWGLKDTDQEEASMEFLDDWKTEYNNAVIKGLPTQDVVAAEGFCSAHYFDAQPGTNLVAVAWYAQGTRLLDTSDPKGIKQVGYFLAPDSTVWATYFSPTDKSVIYTLDHNRGIDVLKIKPAGSVAKRKKVRAPFLASWSKRSVAMGTIAHPTFGWVCRIAL